MISRLGQSRRRHREETKTSSAAGVSLRPMYPANRICKEDPRFLEVPADP